MSKVYITDSVFKNTNPERRILEGIGAEVIELNCTDSSQIPVMAPDADALLTLYLPDISAEVMRSLPNLKGIVRYGIGVDTIDLKAAKELGIQVANVPDYCLDEVSDHAVALALSLVRKVSLSSQRVKAGDYGLHYVSPMKGLRGSVVTVVGFGRIGKLIAKKMAAFNCRTQYVDPYVPGDETDEKVDMDTALASSDIIILQAPSIPETYHILNAEAFGKMKKTPYIVNTARGDLIDTDALERALKDGAIAGAALDVVEGTSKIDSGFSLCKYENVLLTPHSAWYSEDALVALQVLAAEEIKRILGGLPVRSNVIK